MYINRYIINVCETTMYVSIFEYMKICLLPHRQQSFITNRKLLIVCTNIMTVASSGTVLVDAGRCRNVFACPRLV
jgi:hypothetical protein